VGTSGNMGRREMCSGAIRTVAEGAWKCNTGVWKEAGVEDWWVERGV
jgi:hypothetical protein